MAFTVAFRNIPGAALEGGSSPCAVGAVSRTVLSFEQGPCLFGPAPHASVRRSLRGSSSL